MKIIDNIPFYGKIRLKDVKRKKFGIIDDIPLIANIKVKHIRQIKREDLHLANIFQIKYIYIFFLVLVFFIYGLILSEVIDFIFPDHDDTKDDHYIIAEIIGEVGIVYIIYYLLKNHINIFIDILFNKLHEKRPFFLSELLLVSFSYGIYKKLTKYNDKTSYIKKKYIDYLINIRDSIFDKIKKYYYENIQKIWNH
jgi:hypothetical protein